MHQLDSLFHRTRTSTEVENRTIISSTYRVHGHKNDDVVTAGLHVFAHVLGDRVPVALVRLLSTVRTLVPDQIVGPWERLSAHVYGLTPVDPYTFACAEWASRYPRMTGCTPPTGTLWSTALFDYESFSAEMTFFSSDLTSLHQCLSFPNESLTKKSRYTFLILVGLFLVRLD